MIALRKLFRVFGRGSLEFLQPANRKVLAYLRRFGGELVLCVANLSRFAQPVELDLSEFEGMRPVEMLGYVEFPVIGEQPYALTPGPYAFMWFELQGQPEPVAAGTEEDPLRADAGWEGLLAGAEPRAPRSRPCCRASFPRSAGSARRRAGSAARRSPTGRRSTTPPSSSSRCSTRAAIPTPASCRSR